MYEKYLTTLTDKDKTLLTMYLRGLITFEYLIDTTYQYIQDIGWLKQWKN
jgi:hypothetical protein